MKQLGLSFPYIEGFMAAFRMEILDDLQPTEKLTLLALLSFADANGECFPSQSKLSRMTGFTRPAVNRQIRRLCDAGYIIKLPPAKDIQRSTATYIITTKIQPISNRHSNVSPLRKTTKEKLTDRSWADGELF